METFLIGKNCIRLAKIPSTNSYLSALACEKSLPEGTVVITDAQVQGRGQRGNSWESEPGKNLTLSVLLKPAFLAPARQFMLNKAVALGIYDFVSASVPAAKDRVRIKWPNDIYIGDKKISGILIENSITGNSLGHSVAGIGINVNQERFSSLAPNPASLKLAAGYDFDLDQCLFSLCFFLERRYLQLRTLSHARPGLLDADYLSSLYRFGEWADYRKEGKKIRAKITGISESGKLVLEGMVGSFECDFKEIEFLF